ncbi:MAG TPA: alpha/beta hydrolase [Candidatus Binatia bacterium]|nr:alpha/beta hydrolase [Candidatus Binatia bacterium]
MKKAWLLHGTGGSAKDYFWFTNTKQYLESKGYEVWWPLLPNTDKPELVKTRNFMEDDDVHFVWDKETIIIAHSSACPLMLHLLQYFKTSVKQVILVSGFYQPIDDEGFSELMLQKEEYDWQAVKDAAKEIILINSDNDPWGCDDKQARPVAIKLEAPLIVATGQGHMGSGTYNQPYKEFPLLKRLVA